MNIGKSVFVFFALFLIGVFLFRINLKQSYIVISALILLVFGIFLFIYYADKKYLIICLLIPSIILGYGYAKVYKNINYKFFDFVPKSTVEISGKVISNPKYTPTSVSFIVKLDKGEKILITSKPYDFVKYNDNVAISGQLDDLNDNQKWAKERYVFAQMFYPQKIVVIKNNQSLLGSLYNFQNQFIKVFKKTNYSNEGALAGGIILGDSGAGFTKEFNQYLKNSGTSHITALSGYNITILVVAISSLIGYFFSQKKSFYITCVFIIIFTLMTGASASVVRAALMGYLVLLAEKVSRVFNFPNAVAFSAFTMILINPNVLTFDAGFLLSFSALFGITYISPIIYSLINTKNDIYQSLWKCFSQTTGAQIAVIPILCKLFGGFSIISLLSNILILWLIPAAMAVSLIIGIVGLFGTVLSNVFSIIFYPVFWYITFIIKNLGSITIVPLNMGNMGLIIYYLVIIIVIIKYRANIQENQLSIV